MTIIMTSSAVAPPTPPRLTTPSRPPPDDADAAAAHDAMIAPHRPPPTTMSDARVLANAAAARAMFQHGYDNYLEHAFPHDELRPISRTYTDSLGELGNLKREHLSETYAGVALTLIDATSTLAVLGNVTEVRSIHWFPYDRVGVVNADP